MTFTKEIRNGRLFLYIQGDLVSEKDGEPLAQVVQEAFQQEVKQGVIDISALRHINSNGLGVLITLLTKFRNRGGDIYLVNPSESVQKLLVITKLNSIFTILRNEDEIPQQ